MKLSALTPDLPLPLTHWITHWITRWIKRSLLVLMIGCMVLGFIALLGWLLAPGMIKAQVSTQITTQTGRQAQIGDLKLNLLSGEVTLLDTRLFEADQHTVWLSVPRFYLNVSLWGSLFRRAPVLDELAIDAPQLRIVRTDDTRFNFSDVLDKVLAKPSSPDKAYFSLNNVHVNQGRIDYQDMRPSNPANHVLSDITLALPFISNLNYAADIFIRPAFSARLNGTHIGAEGQSKPFIDSRDTELHLIIEALSLPDYLNLLPSSLGVKVVSANLGSDLTLHFKQTGAQQNLTLHGHLSLDNTVVQSADHQPLISIKQVTADLNAIDVAKQQVQLSHLQFDSPDIAVTRDQSGALNWVQAIAQASGSKSPASGLSTKPSTAKHNTNVVPASEKQSWQIGLTQLDVHNGTLTWLDKATQPSFTKKLQGIDLQISHFNNHADSRRQQAMPIHLQARTEADEHIEHQGNLALGSLQGDGTLQLQQIRVSDYMPYIAPFITPQLKQGLLDAKLHYQFTLHNDQLALRLQDSSASLGQLIVQHPSTPTPWLTLGSINVSGLTLDTQAQQLSVASVLLDASRVNVQRHAQGQLNWLSLLRPSATSAPPKPTTETRTPWQWQVEDIEVKQTALAFDDLSVNSHQQTGVHLRLDPISLRLRNASSDSTHPLDFTLDTRFNQQGQLLLQGKGSLSPFKLALDMDAKSLDIAAFDAYLSQFLNLNLAQGRLSSKGHLDLASTPPQPLRIAYRGQATLAQLRALDKVNAADFVRLDRLNLSQIDMQYPGNLPNQSFSLKLGQIALNDFYARIILNANGRINLRDVLAKPETNPSITTPDTRSAEEIQQTKDDASTPNPHAPRPFIQIEKIGLQKGFINFTDNLIRPNYTVDLTGIEGSLAKLDSHSNVPANLALQGRVSNDAPLLVNGQLNPFGKDLFADIKASANGIELTQLTPYAAKYAGYAIEKGKLSVDLSYHIANGQVDANNKLYLDQLTFGERVNSPDATSLPVLLAVSLLKDSQGVIDINLPISGSLSDPQFSIGNVIGRVIVNLLTKVITSPFSLLSSLFGGSSEELAYIQFAPGLAQLDDSAQKKIASLIQALQSRPNLKMEITGHADPLTDTEGLRKAKLYGEMKKIKQRAHIPTEQTGQPSEANDDAENVANNQPDYLPLLEQVYSASKINKPRNMIGIAKNLSANDMEKLLLDSYSVNPDDLLQLANQRANAVKTALLAQQTIAPERLFLTASKTHTETREENKNSAPNRVEFVLK